MLNGVIRVHIQYGKLSEAEPLCRRELAILEKIHDSEHSDIADRLRQLAFVCVNQGKIQEVSEYEILN